MIEADDKLFIELSSKRAEVEADLKKIEKYIYELETKYLDSTQNIGIYNAY